MLEEAKSAIEIIEKHHQFYIFLLSTYIISMGLLQGRSKYIWYEREEQRRKDQLLPVASLFSPSGRLAQPLTKESLFQGGLEGFFVVLFLLAMVAGQLVFLPGVPSLTIFSSMVLFIAPFLILLIMQQFSKLLAYGAITVRKSIPNAIAIILSIALVITGALPSFNMLDADHLIIIAFSSIVILSWFFTYMTGAVKGCEAANLARSYPLVTIERLRGEKIERAWLYERTDSDYRLVTTTGSNYIIPASNVKQIEGPIAPESRADKK